MIPFQISGFACVLDGNLIGVVFASLVLIIRTIATRPASLRDCGRDCSSVSICPVKETVICSIQSSL